MQEPVAYHWAARARYPNKPFDIRVACVLAWEELRALFPQVFAATLMPNHLHLVSSEPPDDKRTAFARLLRRYGDWEELSAPEALPDLSHLKRNIRYVHLNPCRDLLCRDPLEWEWSTHRDYAGAVVSAWPQVTEVFRQFRWKDFAAFHAYVSGDPSVHPMGSPPPLTPLKPAVIDLPTIELAAIRACRVDTRAFRRKGHFRAQLMRSLWGAGLQPLQIARYFNVHITSVQAPRREDADWLKPVLIVASDRRLLGNPLQLGFRAEKEAISLAET